MWSVAARKLGLHSKTQASECSVAWLQGLEGVADGQE